MRRARLATRSQRAGWCMTLVGSFVMAGPLPAQTDYYNLDHGRPLRTEDAYATERYAVELKVSPLTLTRAPGGAWAYRPMVEMKYGILPGLEISAGVEPVIRRGAGVASESAGEAEFSALLNLNTETLGLPALGVRLSTHVPLEPDEGMAFEAKGIITRTLIGPIRAHLNGAWLLGDGREDDWWAGGALDYVLPFDATLLLAEAVVGQPRLAGQSLRVVTTFGLRRQLTPSLGMDAGVGRALRGEGDDWRITFGLTGTMGARRLIPTR